MQSINNLLDSAVSSSHTHTDADELDEINNGLVVCKVCGKPKQKKLTLAGRDKPLIVHVLCECEERAERERREREERAEREAKADRARRECFAASGFYRACTFDSDDRANPTVSDICKRFSDTFDPADPFGLMLLGGVGTGKTFMSSAIANRVIDRGFSALQSDMSRIVTLMESSFEHRQRNLDRILGYDLLLIEDLGAQRDTPYMMEHVYAVIDGRYKAGKPMIITTNMTPEGVAAARGNETWNRILDRISERCYPIKVTGTDRRCKKAKRMHEAMGKRLAGY